MELHEAPAVYEHVIHYDEEKQTQIRVSVNTFRGIEYLSVRKYYMDFNEEWLPTRDGVSMPIDFNNSRELFRSLIEIISLAESKELIEEHFGDLINSVYEHDS